MTQPRSGYSRTAIVLHWLMALLLVGNFAGGLLMGNLFDSHDPATRELGPVVAQLHKSLGLTILMLSLLRLGVRLANGVPPLPDHCLLYTSSCRSAKASSRRLPARKASWKSLASWTF